MKMLRSVFWFASWFAAANLAASAPLSSLGHNVFPTVLLNLDESNSSHTKCVTVNGRDLCTTVNNCSREAYQCDYLDPKIGHGCSMDTYMCDCTVIYGNQTCHCEVSPLVPYWVEARAFCYEADEGSANSLILSTDTPHVYCSDPVGYYYPPYVSQHEKNACYQGYSHFSMNGGHLSLNWKCREEDDPLSSRAVTRNNVPHSEPDKICTCEARYRSHACESCEPCPHDAPSSFRAVCPGFFTDCFQTFSVWDDEANTSGSTRMSLVFGAMMILLLTVSFRAGMAWRIR